MKPKPENFDVVNVPLKDSNLIEASAGTGKTYSIGIMVLRLIVEEDILIQQILMVTFTKSAVAELEERIRLFVRLAYKQCEHENIEDQTIKDIVNSAIAKHGKQKVTENLKNALLFLDETAVLTIHSFCQQTLTGFAFETAQLFGAETLQNTSLIIEDEVNKFWRRYVTSMPAELLKSLLNNSFSRSSISAVVSAHLQGKMYFAYNSLQSYQLMSDDFNQMLSELKQFQNDIDERYQLIVQFINDNSDSIIRDCEANGYARKGLLPLIGQTEEFINAVYEKSDKAYIIKLFSNTLLPLIANWVSAKEAFDSYISQIISRINLFAIEIITKGVHDFKILNNMLSFDDMIVNLHKAVVVKNNTTLIKALRTKYKAVFIDEFQDTDRLQYEIFEKAFGDETVLFYIGDPKQSIYAWRKADIFTYFKAANTVDHLYHMNRNFRSTEKMIAAMNLLFLPDEQFDTFYFGNQENTIQYIHVESPPINTNGTFYLNETEDVPISITTCNKKEEIIQALVNQVTDLFTPGKYSIQKGDRKGITAKDIGVLVRTNKEAYEIKEALLKNGIPAVTINDARILESDEALFMLYLLQAINDVTIGNINRALLSPFTGYSTTDLIEMSADTNAAQFRKYNSVWQEEGIYAALMLFVADYNVKAVLLSQPDNDGERIITNLYQLIELVHKIQNEKNYSPTELIGWLQRGIEGMETEGDQYELRIESDEDAIRIITIHKSKGLDYNIVLAPFLDFVTNNNKARFASFRDPVNGEYISVEKSFMTEEQQSIVEEQLEQENRRLLYVAVTRTRYKCFIYKNAYFKKSTLSVFLNELSQSNHENKELLINEIAPLSKVSGFSYRKPWKPFQEFRQVDFYLANNNWTKMSYTMLAAKNELQTKQADNKAAELYDAFVFNQLSRGLRTGNLLHYLFENVDFSDEKFWQYYIAQSLKRFMPVRNKDMELMLFELVQNAVGAEIQDGERSFLLKEITPDKKIAELEFDFNVPGFTPSDFSDIINQHLPVNLKYADQLEGIMNGKIDLFFQHDNKYYILDWKSNYLGDNLINYSPDVLYDAMSENNYHLQYLIYTVAIKKYLETRVPVFDYDKQFGGVIYLFIRGLRHNSNSGVFFTKPSLQLINTIENIISEQPVI